jgi:DNA-binding transcriptional ArsR family regulator
MKTHFKESFLENSTETLRAIAHPIRIAILDLLYKNGQMTVTDIYTKLNIEQAIASHHLRILKNKNVVVVQRDGKNSLYSLATNDFYDIVETLTKVL